MNSVDFFITIDLGNTNVSAALVGLVSARLTILHHGVAGSRGDLRAFCAICRTLQKSATRKGRTRCAGIVIASVVPGQTRAIAAIASSVFDAPIYHFPRDGNGGLTIGPRPASNVGADRIANAAGAVALLQNSPRVLSAIVVDAGTAVTVDLVDIRKRRFEGGAIAPGARLGARALHAFTSRLPEVKLARSKTLCAKDTRRAIEAGLYFGFRGLVQGLVQQARTERPGALVLAAGGDVLDYLAGAPFEYLHVPGLTHLGLAEALKQITCARPVATPRRRSGRRVQP